MSNEFLLWSAPIMDIKTVFWVLGSQNGGGILLDWGAADNTRDFYRGGAYDSATGLWNLWDTVTAECPIWASAASQSTGAQAIINGITRLNGTAVNGSTAGLSGGYDIVSLRTAGGVGAVASAFNMDRGRKYRNSTGGQRLAEVIIFERTLSDTETAAIESYLSKKWGVSVAQGTSLASSESDMQILLAPGAILALNADGRYVLGTIGGIGTVSGASSLTLSGLESSPKEDASSALAVDGGLAVTDSATWSVTAGDLGVAPIVAAGAVSFGGGGTMTLSNAAALGKGSTLLLSASSLEGFDPSKWTLTADNSAKMSYVLSKTATGVYLVACPKGLEIILR